MAKKNKKGGKKKGPTKPRLKPVSPVVEVLDDVDDGTFDYSLPEVELRNISPGEGMDEKWEFGRELIVTTEEACRIADEMGIKWVVPASNERIAFYFRIEQHDSEHMTAFADRVSVPVEDWRRPRRSHAVRLFEGFVIWRTGSIYAGSNRAEQEKLVQAAAILDEFGVGWVECGSGLWCDDVVPDVVCERLREKLDSIDCKVPIAIPAVAPDNAG